MDNIKKETLINIKLSTPIKSLSLDKDELKKLCDILQERADTAAEIEVKENPKKEQSSEKYDESIQCLRDSFKLKVTIVGKNSEQLYGYVSEVFNSPNFPNSLNSFYINSETTLRANYNYYPRNHFDLLLDFSKPNIFNFNFMPSYSTPNRSFLSVQGYDATWANGVFREITKFISDKASLMSKVHNHSIYDIMLWFLGFPLAFRIAYLSSNVIEEIFADINTFVKNAAYFYIFLATLFVFRIIFHYLRWVCPLVEYRSKNNKILAHRIFIGTIIASILVVILRAIWRAIF